MAKNNNRIERALETIAAATKSTNNVVMEMSKNNIKMNDNYILHNVTMDRVDKNIISIQEDLKRFLLKHFSWLFKVVVTVGIMAILVLAGIKQVPRIIELF